MHPQEYRRMLSATAAAHYLGVGKSSMDKWRLLGSGPKFCTIGRRVVYDPDDLDEFVRARKRSSTSEPLLTAA
jgi:predicted DNA-binding transcriptional regulator AlpA